MKEKVSANKMSISLPDSDRERLNQYRLGTRKGTRIPSEAEIIRGFINDGLARAESERQTA